MTDPDDRDFWRLIPSRTFIDMLREQCDPAFLEKADKAIAEHHRRKQADTPARP